MMLVLPSVGVTDRSKARKARDELRTCMIGPAQMSVACMISDAPASSREVIFHVPIEMVGDKVQYRVETLLDVIFSLRMGQASGDSGRRREWVTMEAMAQF